MTAAQHFSDYECRAQSSITSPKPLKVRCQGTEAIKAPALQVLADAMHDQQQAVDGRARGGLVDRLRMLVYCHVFLVGRRRRVAPPQARPRRACYAPP